MKITNLIVVGAALVLITNGCATNKPLPPGLHTVTKSNGGVKVLSVGLLDDGAGLLVHGTVERTSGYYGSPFRHLDLEVAGPDGQVLSQQAVNFSPNPIPFSRFSPGRSVYTARISETPPAGSTISVSVDNVALSKCSLTSVGSK